MGDMVYATADLYNETLEESAESAIPGIAADALLVAVGTRGVVINVGHAQEMPDAEIYLVRFETGPDGTLADPIGCLQDELSDSTGTAVAAH